MRRVAAGVLLSLCVSLMLAAGCGYRLLSRSGDMELSSLHVAGVENRTTEPRLEDLLHQAIVSEFLRDRRVRIVPASSAAMTLSSTLRVFDVHAAAESDSRVTQYEIRLIGDFRLTDNRSAGVIADFVGLEAPIRETFAVGPDVTRARADQESAEASACEALARELASRVLLR